MHPNSDEVIFACRPNLLVDSVAVSRVAEPPVARPWGNYEMRLHDPDGNVLRVSASATGR